MAGGFVAQLKILLGLDSAEFTKGAKKADAETSKMAKGIAAAAKLAKTALGAMGAVITVDTIMRVTKQALAFTTAIRDQARQAGVTTQALQEYRYAALRAGVSNDQLADGFKELTQKIGEAADGSKSAAAMFQTAGVNIRDANGEVRNAADVLPELADAYNKLGSEAEKSSFAARIFGADAGPKMKALLEQGSAGMASYREAAKELGLVISEENIRKAEEAQKKMKALSEVMQIRIATTVTENADAIGYLADELLRLVDGIGSVLRAMQGFRNIRDTEGWLAALTTDFSDMGKFATREGYMKARPGLFRQATFKSGYKPTDPNRPFDDRFVAPSGGLVGGAVKPTIASPWGGLLNTSLDRRRNAVGGSAFGVTDWSRFTPGGAANDWIKAAEPAVDIAKSAAEIAALNKTAWRELAEVASASAPKLLAAVGQTSREMEQLRAATQAILDRLDPAAAEVRRYREEHATLTAALRAGQISTDDYQRATLALRREFNGFADELREAADLVPIAGMTMKDAIDGANASWDRFTRAMPAKAGASRVQVVQTIEGMAQDVLSSLDRLSGAIRGGGFLDILTGVAGFGLSLGKAGLFGKTVQTNLARTPGLATGGSMILGGRSGIDRNLLSLNGAPLARVSAGERMTISPSNDRAGAGGGRGELIVRLEKDGSLTAHMAGIAGRVVEAAAPGIATAGAGEAMSRLAQRQWRRLG